MKMKLCFFSITCLLALSMIFVVCGDGDEVSGGVVTELNLTNLFNEPEYDQAPHTPNIDTAQYTGTVAWFYSGLTDTLVTGNFEEDRQIRARVSLSAKEGYTFAGLRENAFSYTGAAAVTNNAGTSTTITVSVVFTALFHEVGLVSRWLDRSQLAVDGDGNATGPVYDYREFRFYDDGTFIFMDIYKNNIAEQGTYTMTGDPLEPGTVYETVATYIWSRSWTLNFFPDVIVDGTQTRTLTVGTPPADTLPEPPPDRIGIYATGWYVHPQNGLEEPKWYYDNTDGSYYGGGN